MAALSNTDAHAGEFKLMVQEINASNQERNRRYKSDYYKKLDVNEIIYHLNDVQQLATATDLGIVFEWLWKVHQFGYIAEEKFLSILDHFGFEQVYEIGQKDRCWVYGNQMSEFESINDIESDFYDSSFKLYEGHNFKRYLQYLLMLLSKVTRDTEYKNHDPDYFLEQLDFLEDFWKDEILKQQTDEALKQIRADNEAEDIKEQNEPNRRRNVTCSHYYIAKSMFYQIKEVQELIKGYDGKIFVFDSI